MALLDLDAMMHLANSNGQKLLSLFIDLESASHEYDIIQYSKPYMSLVSEGNFPASTKTTS